MFYCDSRWTALNPIPRSVDHFITCWQVSWLIAVCLMAYAGPSHSFKQWRCKPLCYIQWRRPLRLYEFPITCVSTIKSRIHHFGTTWFRQVNCVTKIHIHPFCKQGIINCKRKALRSSRIPWGEKDFAIMESSNPRITSGEPPFAPTEGEAIMGFKHAPFTVHCSFSILNKPHLIVNRTS